MKNALFAVAVFTAFTASAQAALDPNLLVNGSFEAVVISADPWYVRSFASTPGWVQFADGVDLIENTYAQGPPVLVKASDGKNFLDMNQAGSLGGIYQTVSAGAGQQFHLQLDATAWATNARGGTLGYELYDPASTSVLASGSFTDPIGGIWVTRSLDATAISSSIGVRIQGLVATQAGMGLDRVVLTVSAVPEPETYTLLAAGLGIVAWLARRRPA